MSKVEVIISKNTDDTTRIAETFLGKIFKEKTKKAIVVGLYGDLGAGKTTFTQAVAKTLGIKRKVNSPTFVIMKKYSIKHGQHKFLFHIDAYRLKNRKEIENLGWKDILANSEHLVFVEWPENIIEVLPKHHQVKISHLSSKGKNTKEKHRIFNLKYHINR